MKESRVSSEDQKEAFADLLNWAVDTKVSGPTHLQFISLVCSFDFLFFRLHAAPVKLHHLITL